MAEKKQNIVPVWKKLMKNFDLDEPTSFLDHAYLGCTKIIVDEYIKMFESRISAGAIEKYQGGKNLTQRRSHGPSTWKGILKKALRDCELAKKEAKQLCKVSSPCLDDRHFKKEELYSVGELSKVRPQIVLKCLYLARIGGPTSG